MNLLNLFSIIKYIRILSTLQYLDRILFYISIHFNKVISYQFLFIYMSKSGHKVVHKVYKMFFINITMSFMKKFLPLFQLAMNPITIPMTSILLNRIYNAKECGIKELDIEVILKCILKKIVRPCCCNFKTFLESNIN